MKATHQRGGGWAKFKVPKKYKVLAHECRYGARDAFRMGPGLFTLLQLDSGYARRKVKF